MTLEAAWLRRAGTSQELVFCSDSRLSGGETWDRGPKLFQLPRSDALIAFAGATYFALPAVQQLISAIACYPPSVRRSSDLEVAAGHALRVFNEIYSDRRDFPSGGDGGPGADFLLGGWSWRAGKFRLWHIAWSRDAKAFKLNPVRPQKRRPGVLCWFSGSPEAVFDARMSLERTLHSRQWPADQLLDMEPLAIIAEAIRNGEYRDIGGAPQVMKVYRHMNTQQFAVRWPSGKGDVIPHVSGRPLLPYEIAHVPILEPGAWDMEPTAATLPAQDFTAATEVALPTTPSRRATVDNGGPSRPPSGRAN
jgi:hypothetical protein